MTPRLILSIAAAALSLLILPACGPDDPCVRTSYVCLARETPDNLVREGTWKGTYEVGRYLLGEQSLRLTWENGAYKAKARRDGLDRLFYRRDPFYGYGDLKEGQTHFTADYSRDERWYFYGRFYNDGAKLVYKGWIESHGEQIGTFRLTRNRRCLTLLKKEENICVSEVETNDLAPVLRDVVVSPNPVTAGTELRLEASVEPTAEWVWKVDIATLADPEEKLIEYEMQAPSFALDVSAPTEPGRYVVTFEVVGNNEIDKWEELLEVTP